MFYSYFQEGYKTSSLLLLFQKLHSLQLLQILLHQFLLFYNLLIQFQMLNNLHFIDVFLCSYLFLIMKEDLHKTSEYYQLLIWLTQQESKQAHIFSQYIHKKDQNPFISDNMFEQEEVENYFNVLLFIFQLFLIILLVIFYLKNLLLFQAYQSDSLLFFLSQSINVFFYLFLFQNLNLLPTMKGKLKDLMMKVFVNLLFKLLFLRSEVHNLISFFHLLFSMKMVLQMQEVSLINQETHLIFKDSQLFYYFKMQEQVFNLSE